MTGPSHQLPKLLAEIAEAIGTGAALRLAQDHGGRILAVPKQPTAAFVDKVGEATAAWLCENHGPGYVDVPLGPTGDRADRAARLRQAIEQREGSASELARRFGVAARTVKRHRAHARDGDGDLPLFSSLKSDT
jgi:hypothetical protein